MTVFIYSKLTGKFESGNLVRVVRMNNAGQTTRVSEYLERSGDHRPISEMVHYENGSRSFYLYDESGEVHQIIQYDKQGLEVSHTTMGQAITPESRSMLIKGVA